MHECKNDERIRVLEISSAEDNIIKMTSITTAGTTAETTSFGGVIR